MRDDGTSLLAKLFPNTPTHVKQHRVRNHPGNAANFTPGAPGKPAREDVPTRWAGIYTLELRGLTQEAIANALGMSSSSIARIVMDERYITYRNTRLAELDQDFVAMKPLAFNALRGALNSSDENTALRASETWFKGASFGGYSRTERQQSGLTAEDVAAALLRGTAAPLVQVNTQVNVTTADSTLADE